MALRYGGSYRAGQPEVAQLFEDNGYTYGEGPWTDLLAGQTTIRVEWSTNGITWGGTNVDLVDGRIHLNHAAIADGREWLVRFVIAGVTYGPISVRYYD